MDPFSRKKIAQEKPSKPSFSQQKVKKTSNQKVSASLMRRFFRWIPKNKQEYQQKKIPFVLLLITLLIAFGVIFKVTFTAYQYVVNFQVNDLLALFSTELEEDQQNHTNILLLGTGGGDHDGADLTDTIIVASVNNNSNKISMLSIPRDLWLDMPGYGSSRINKIYDTLKEKNGSEQALDILKNGVENITNLSIPYYVKIDFEGFKKVIDTLGGVEIEVEKSIFDQAYPTPDGRYEVFSIDAGQQVLDGETALKYARSRHSTSDFDRAARQQQLINAIRDKAEQRDVFSSPLLLKQLYEDFTDNVETNMSITELITLARVAKDIQSENISSAVIKDIDIIDTGSFLYTPDRELYGGAFVLIPVGNSYERIQSFIQMLFAVPEFFKENAQIQILNGTRRPGLAATLGEKLIPYGFNIQRYDNAGERDYEGISYYIFNPERTKNSDEALQILLPESTKLSGEPPSGANPLYDISIIIGENVNLSDL